MQYTHPDYDEKLIEELKKLFCTETNKTRMNIRINRAVTEIEESYIRSRNTCSLMEFWREHYELNTIAELAF